jgi:hypothetical protein
VYVNIPALEGAVPDAPTRAHVVDAETTTEGLA